MTKIYDQHEAAFARVSAFVVLGESQERVANIAFKHPADGAGRLYAYVHWFGIEMVRGHAAGGGYDKKTGACSAARLPFPKKVEDALGLRYAEYERFRNALASDRGPTWDQALRQAGFTVLQAV
jgi:hypothetical protein